MNEPDFMLLGLSLPEGEDPLGIWDVAPETVSFGKETSDPEMPTWRVTLPATPVAAQARLSAREEALSRGRHDLVYVARMLAQFEPSEVVSFDVHDPIREERRALRESVFRFQEPVAFAAGQPERLMDDEAYRGWTKFVARIRQMVAHYARIETLVEEQFVGRTEVDWTGDFNTTVWSPEVQWPSMVKHRRAVHLALASRIALVRIVSVVATGAVGLALKASVPGGQLLLLPATWRFVRDVLKELRRSWPDLQL